MEEYDAIEKEKNYIDWKIAKKRLKKDMIEIYYGLYCGVLVGLFIVVFTTIVWMMRVI